MCNLKGVAIVVLAALFITGCSSTKKEVLKEEAKIYSQTKVVYCGSLGDKTYYEDDDFIIIVCGDDSVKFINIEE